VSSNESAREDPAKSAARDAAGERASQLDFYREQIDAEEEISRPRCYPRPVQFLLERKFAWVLDQLERKLVRASATAGALAGRSALVVCCGSGMESEMLARRGLRVVALDISGEAVERARERARRYDVHYELLVGDAENLPFPDDAFSIVFVHDGLHHLPEAYRGVREMLRVAREAVVVAEPADAALTRLSVKLGLSGEYEDAGNFVYRLRKDKLVAVFQACGLRDWSFRRNLIYYQPWTHRIYRWFEKPPLYWLFCAGFHVVNLFLGRWGNSLRAVAWKDASTAHPARP
jgi:SAM-dependent methyltransferase